MNKKTVMFASGATGLILALSACGKGTYGYEVSGTVQEQYVDYDCPGEDLSMDAVAFVDAKNPGTTGKKQSDSGSSGDDKKPDDKKKDSKAGNQQGAGQQPQAAPQGVPQGGKKSTTPSPAATKNSGVKLKSKPDKPEKVKNGKVPTRKYKSKPKGCKEEYEIFVVDSSGDLYEQDVRQADYDKCLAVTSTPKLFPLCTKG